MKIIEKIKNFWLGLFHPEVIEIQKNEKIKAQIEIIKNLDWTDAISQTFNANGSEFVGRIDEIKTIRDDVKSKTYDVLKEFKIRKSTSSYDIDIKDVLREISLFKINFKNIFTGEFLDHSFEYFNNNQNYNDTSIEAQFLNAFKLILKMGDNIRRTPEQRVQELSAHVKEIKSKKPK